jgi:serine/threonine protein kinase
MPLAAGTKLGPYEIVAALGAGGMGEVYKARDTRLERTVAIKILPAALAGDPEFAERFEREARAISSLDHPNICALYDVGTTPGAADANDPSKPLPGVSFLVMQYVDGRTLADRLSGGPLPIAQVLRLAIEMADALDHAHRSGIVHRDLKPANVMLTGSGATRSASPSKLLDFGLAKLRQTPPPAGLSGATRMADQPVTARGTILGTVQYMAPEQVEGGRPCGFVRSTRRSRSCCRAPKTRRRRSGRPTAASSGSSRKTGSRKSTFAAARRRPCATATCRRMPAGARGIAMT